jgi:hypothetical protein
MHACLVIGAASVAACGGPEGPQYSGTVHAPTTGQEPATPVAAAKEVALRERVARLEAEAGAAKEVSQRERTARIEGEVRGARLEYELAVEKYNHATTEALCDVARGVKNTPAAARVEAAGERVKSFMAGCKESEPVNACVERKARDSAR